MGCGHDPLKWRISQPNGLRVTSTRHDSTLTPTLMLRPSSFQRMRLLAAFGHGMLE
jgi:hypothetical protein